MDAQQALADLTEISSQIETAILFDAKGEVAASTLADEARTRELAGAAAELLEGAGQVTTGDGRLTQIEVSMRDGSVFLVADGDRRIVATTSAQPTVGLVFYDLKSCLRSAAEEPAKPKPKRTRKKKTEEPGGDAA